MWVVTVQQAEGGDIQNINDGRGHDGEEGDTREHPEQSQPSDKQQECWESKHRWQVCDYQVVRCHKNTTAQEWAHLPSQKTKPTADIIVVTTAKVTKSPTGTAAMALNIRAVRATNEWLLRYRPSLVFSNRATCKRSGFSAAGRQTISWWTQIRENIKNFDRWRCEVLGYPGVIL